MKSPERTAAAALEQSLYQSTGKINPDIHRIQNERSSTTASLPLLIGLIHEKSYATRARLIVDEWQNTGPHNQRFAKPQ
jgi:hypothetical protein